MENIRIPDIRRQDLGLKILHEPQDVDTIDVDIVAVHGIMAPPNTTWTHPKTNTNWLSDPSMLPESLKGFGARIMAFGYDSRWFGKDSVKQSLHTLAENLLHELNQEREACSKRPIVFIAHCFGGLIIQKAFTIACLQVEDFPGLWYSMRGMMFLGTPHHGVNDSSGLSKQGQVYAHIVASKTEIQDNVLQTIVRDNDILVSAVSEFNRKVNTSKPSPKIFCFYELKPTNIAAIIGQKLPKEFVIGESSATLAGHEKQGLALDHFEINKFEDKLDNHYRNVSYQIRKMVKEAKAFTEKETAVSINTPLQVSDSRISVLPAILGKRNNFALRQNILDRIEERLSSKRGMAALCGEPGSGKTHVAVEYADQYVRNNGASNCQVFWVNAATAEEFEASYKRIGARVRVSPVGLSHDGYLSAINEHLKHEEQWLLVLDGLNDDDSLRSTNPDHGQEAKSLLSFLPTPSDSCRLLVTTMQKTVAIRLMNSKDKYVIPVGDLDDDDASRLLLGRVTNDPVRKKRISEIISIVGDSAGALELVRLCGMSTNKGISSELLEALRAQLRGESNGESPTSAWDLLWSSLKMKNADVAYWLHAIGLLDVQMVPNIFFTSNDRKTRLEELTSLGLVEASDGRSFYRVPNFFRQCLQSSLSEKHKLAAEATILQSVNTKFAEDNRNILLPVALAALRLKPSHPEAKREQEALREKVAIFKRQRQASLSQASGYIVGDHRRSSTTSALGDVSRNAIEGAPAHRAYLPAPDQRALPNGNGVFQSSQLPHALRPKELEWEKKRKELRKDSGIAAQMLSHKKPSSQSSGDATSIYRRVLDSYSAEPCEYLALASLQYNVGIAEGSNGNVDDAANLFHQALKTILSSDDLNALEPKAIKLYYRIFTDLASMYACNGRLAEAQETFEQFIPTQVAALGEESQETLKARHEYARVLLQQGETENGAQELEKVLEASDRQLGRNHRDTLNLRCTLAQHLASNGKRQEAIDMLVEVLEEQRKTLGSSHRETEATREQLDELRKDAVN